MRWQKWEWSDGLQEAKPTLQKEQGVRMTAEFQGHSFWKGFQLERGLASYINCNKLSE
jgi:hypothetical protein